MQKNKKEKKEKKRKKKEKKEKKKKRKEKKRKKKKKSQGRARLGHQALLPVALKQLTDVVELVLVAVLLPQVRPVLLCRGGGAELAPVWKIGQRDGRDDQGDDVDTYSASRPAGPSA